MNNHQDTASLARLQLSTCAVNGCSLPKRNGHSKFCLTHYARKRRTGHPLGGSLKKSTLGPLVEEATDYILTNRQASPIVGGVSWAGAWLLSGQHYGDHYPGMTHQQVVDSLIFQQERQGIDPVQVLATLAACRYLEEYQPGTFRDEHHFRFQTGKALLHMTPFPLIRVSSRQGVERKEFLRPAPKVFDLAYLTIAPQAHVLAHNIAQKLHEPWLWKTKTMTAMKQPLPRMNHLER